MRKRKFKGWDYTEIGKAIGFEHDDDDEYPKALAEELWNRLGGAGEGSGADWPNGEPEICREYLRALAKIGDYSAPVYNGMLEVSDDYTFMQWFCGNIGRMWT